MRVAENKDSLFYEKSKLKQISQFLGEEKGQSKYLYPKFSQEEVKASENFVYFKTIVFIGYIETVKTASINYFLNLFLGVKFEDNLKFLLINEKLSSGTQAVGQNQDVHIYYVKPFNGNPALRIVDTPELQYTEEWYQVKIDKITELFTKQIDPHTTICFVAKASDDIFDKKFHSFIRAFLDMFGKDILHNFVSLITHWDGIEETPKAIKTLSFKEEINEYKYFNFCIKHLNLKAVWQDSLETLNDFLEQKIINRYDVDVSLMMNKEVLKHYLYLDYKESEYEKTLNYGLYQIKRIRIIFNELEIQEQQIVASQNFNRNIIRICKTQLQTGFWVINCDCCIKKQTRSQRKKILLEKLNEYFTKLAKLIYELEDFLFRLKKLNIKIKGIRSPKNESDLTYLDSLIREEQESKEIDSSKALKTFSNLQICLKLIKNDLNYQFDEKDNHKVFPFKRRCAWKIEEYYEKKFFSII